MVLQAHFNQDGDLLRRSIPLQVTFSSLTGAGMVELSPVGPPGAVVAGTVGPAAALGTAVGVLGPSCTEAAAFCCCLFFRFFFGSCKTF